VGEPTGVLRGKDAIRRYWCKALDRNPALRFELVTVFLGAASVTLTYRGPRGLSAEVFSFDADGMVFRAAAHYTASV
jgi:hypothetical protein